MTTNLTSAALDLHVGAETPQGLAQASEQLRAYLDQHGVGGRPLYAADLALEELGKNILSYAFPQGGSPAFDLHASVGPDKVELVFEDDGVPFDPAKAPAPPKPASLEEAAEGGLGIHMVRRVVQRMTHSRHHDRNRLKVLIALDGGIMA